MRGAADRRIVQFSPNSRNGFLQQSQNIHLFLSFSAYTDACISSCKIVVASKRPLIAFPSMWNNLLKQSLLKCSEQTMNRPLGLEFFRCKLSISRPLFASDQCREIPVAGCDESPQPWTTQRLIMPQEHAENKNYLVVFRRPKYTIFLNENFHSVY